MVLKRIKQWNEDINNAQNLSGLIYHMTHMVNEVNWANEDAVKGFGAKLNTKCERQIVPLDLQFRLSKIIILLLNVLAEKGNQSWYAVFNKSIVGYECCHKQIISTGSSTTILQFQWEMVSGKGILWCTPE
jgi:hypothetical protein